MRWVKDFILNILVITIIRLRVMEDTFLMEDTRRARLALLIWMGSIRIRLEWTLLLLVGGLTLARTLISVGRKLRAFIIIGVLRSRVNAFKAIT